MLNIVHMVSGFNGPSNAKPLGEQLIEERYLVSKEL
jgi:hypothetical protein